MLSIYQLKLLNFDPFCVIAKIIRYYRTVGLQTFCMQRTRPAWPTKTKLRTTLDCSRIAKEIATMNGIFYL